jgi:hemoglobin
MNQLRQGEWIPTEADTPYTRLGGSDSVRALAEAFYDAMDSQEPALARLHQLDSAGKVARPMRERFAMFLIGWLGGPQEYMEKYGHPRLRMRHSKVPIDSEMRSAWLRCMLSAMNAQNVEGDVRSYLNARFAEVAEFLINR